MKPVLFLCCALFSLSVCRSQSAMPPMDQSPLDISYYPTDFPLLSIQNKVSGAPVARAIYSRPQKKDRKIFGDLVPYGSVWRLGANEATEIEFFKDVKFNKKKIGKGRYTLYALPAADKWTIILNKANDTWGAYKYDASKDLARMDVPIATTDSSSEAFTLFFEKGSDASANIVVTWDMTQVKIPFSW